MDRDSLEAFILTLKAEIEELDRAGRIYMSRRYHSSVERRAQDERIVRLEEIKRQLDSLSRRNLQ